MQFCIDIVDLLQLYEVWSRNPILVAFGRLEGRSAAVPAAMEFTLDDLLPRLYRLRRSPAWLDDERRSTDPGRLPLGHFTDAFLSEMYPESESAAHQRRILFTSAYARFVLTHFRHDPALLAATLRALTLARRLFPTDHLSLDNLPLAGAPDWIPAEITDEIRALDSRYDPAEPGTPAAYVIADDFWDLLRKVGTAEAQAAQALAGHSDSHSILQALLTAAHDWQRSPSVVALCYLSQEAPHPYD